MFPMDAAQAVADRVLVEVRDVSYADQPSTVLAQHELRHVKVAPGAAVPFQLSAPQVAADRQVSLRVQVDLAPGRSSPAGDYLTTAAAPVPPAGAAIGLIVPLTRI